MRTKQREQKAQEQFAEARREELITKLSTAFQAQLPVVIAVLDMQAELINKFMNEQGFWESDNTGEKLALIHSEISEALEADRANANSEKIAFTGVEEELADAMIRILDFAGQHQLNLGAALIAKMQYNLTRPRKHGKAY